ncbi:endonuclease/exonuclease/phosphatase family protein [Stutzerimonas zhaodongensis]|jgi:endonuclease/exonuclease/phosphatase (EEP) superfamily protein YafD|uniref:endonuclease/exonuclease/phosphatase family protein n=1 Tax=Stutzerimonas zhaodongensis TaxID=1176257 RepID=UPI001F4EEC59|nr:endonuclease/exonuclease/phosphatase family protein [Stutzerimonas zhaodongensis]UNG16755.1 endonuclease/exonuclease/phosphatase family protein [Stutzerimonas zhaodongensis]
MTEEILLAATGLLVVLTFLPLWKNPVWWVRGLDFPRLQLCVLAFALLLAQALLLSYAKPLQVLISALSILCLAYQAWWIIPYTRLWRPEVKTAVPDREKPRIRVMAANVLTPNRQTDKLKALVREHRPDILVTLETDQWWEDQLEELSNEYPYSCRCPLDNLYGMHVWSRLPLENAETRFLVEDDVPSMHAKVRLTDQLAIRMHFLHPAPPSPTENDESTERDVELLVVAESVRDDLEDIPVIVTGDLNDVAWSPNTRLFRKISGLLDPRVGRGMVNSFHAQHWFLRWPLDHLFHSHHFQLVRIQRLPEFGSDHFPVLVELQYDPAPEQQSLQGDAEDEDEAEEKIRKEGVSESDVPEPEKH